MYIHAYFRSVCVGCIIGFLFPEKPTIVHLYQASELGSRLTLVCEVDCCAVLACSVSWLYNGQPIDLTNAMYTVSYNGSIHKLSVLQPGEGEVGKYTCVLSSRFEETEDSKIVQLVLPGKTVGGIGMSYVCYNAVSLHPIPWHTDGGEPVWLITTQHK